MPTGDGADEGASRPVPDPLDRLWIHPSELLAPHGAPRQRRRGPHGRSEWLLALMAGGVGALAALAILTATGWLGRPAGRAAQTDAEIVARIASRAAPSVVSVAIPGRRQQASGVCVGAELVLTSADALGDAGAAVITLGDGRDHAAMLMGRDTASGLALLRVEGLRLVGAPMSARPALRIGDTIVAVGGGDHAHHWMTAGKVSSLTAVVTPEGAPARRGLIGTDALVADDAPGGALFDGGGQLVGILALPPAGHTVGIAVPTDLARSVTEQMRATSATGAVPHGWIGVGGSDASDRPGGGARVEQVAAGSPAAAAGLTPGDVITKVDGNAVPDMATLMVAVRGRRPGDRLDVEVTRDGGDRAASVQLGAYPPR